MNGAGDGLIPIAIMIALGGIALVARQVWASTQPPPKPAPKPRAQKKK